MSDKDKKTLALPARIIIIFLICTADILVAAYFIYTWKQNGTVVVVRNASDNIFGIFQPESGCFYGCNHSDFNFFHDIKKKIHIRNVPKNIRKKAEDNGAYPDSDSWGSNRFLFDYKSR